jgi:hypothetical protein
MITVKNLPKNIDDITWQDVQNCFVYPPERPPVRLLKVETGLPVNILNVTYGVSFEIGLIEWVEVQTNTNDEIDENNYEIFWFNENAETVLGNSNMTTELLTIVQDYIKKSYADENSLLYKTMQKRKEEWERDVDKMKEERKGI